MLLPHSLLESLRLKSKEIIKRAFCGEESDPNLDCNRFYDFLKLKLGLGVNTEDAQKLYYAIDIYNKGVINYRKLVEYLEYYEERRSSGVDEEIFHPNPSFYRGVRCQDSIFEWTIYEELKDSLDEISGHYVSISRGGLLSFWRRDFRKHFEGTIAVSDDGDKMTAMATGLSCLPRYKMTAVATTAADIRFFNADSYKFRHEFSILWLPAVVVHMDCDNSETITCGDFTGNVFVLNTMASFFTRLKKRASHLGPQRMTFEDLRKGLVAGLQVETTAKSHFTNVEKVRYISKLRIVVSCSVNTKRAMMIHHLDRNESSSFVSEGGITSFDFSEKLNCLVTGGIDNSVKVWNLSKSSFSENLSGHFNSVTHVLVYEKRLHAISADRDKTIRVWNLLRPECLQVIKFKDIDFAGKHIFATLYLDNQLDKLIITTHRVAVLTAHSADVRSTSHPTSELVTFAAYNKVFDCFITVGNKASIAVWSALSFSLLNEFSDVTSTRTGVPHSVDISAAGLDPTERRLVTADRTGAVKVWNFHLGICLKEFKAKFSILALSIRGYEIFAAGSSGLIQIFYDDGESVVEDFEWEPLHEHAVVSIDTYQHNLLASASCDGEIIVWLWKNEDAKLRMRDEVSPELSEETRPYLAQPLVEKRKTCSISEILFLKTREMDACVGNLVSCGVDGRIRFWNVISTHKINKGKLLSKFRAVFGKFDGVLCMETDKENKFLLAGDTLGYLRVYHLEDYYSKYGSIPTNAKHPERHHYDKYPFLNLKHSKHNRHSGDDAEVGFPPLLLNCFRTHVGPVLKIAFSNERELVITAARQGSVRLWTLSGIYLGFLGSEDEYPEPQAKLKPPDIQATASATTLYILNGSRKPYWERAVEALQRCRLGSTTEEPQERPFAWIDVKKYPPKEFSEEFALHHELEKRLRTGNPAL